VTAADVASGMLVGMTTASPPEGVDPNWIEQLIAVGYELGEVDLPVPEDLPATAAYLIGPDDVIVLDPMS
jgi:hypothetical protein